jgi:hypothetical protein
MHGSRCQRDFLQEFFRVMLTHIHGKWSTTSYVAARRNVSNPNDTDKILQVCNIRNLVSSISIMLYCLSVKYKIPYTQLTCSKGIALFISSYTNDDTVFTIPTMFCIKVKILLSLLTEQKYGFSS